MDRFGIKGVPLGKDQMRTRILCFIVLLLGWQGLLAQAADSCSCCSDDHRAFDFWIGKWEVRQADGTMAGINQITRVQDSCALQEQWSSARPGHTGTSLNFYNGSTGYWEQLWIDNSGGILKLKGGRKGNQMILASEPAAGPDGAVYVNRITWSLLEDGRVRQLWEAIPGEGPARVLFDGFYQKIRE